MINQSMSAESPNSNPDSSETPQQPAKKIPTDDYYLNTRWSQVQRAHAGNARAKEDLARAYWQPLHRYAMLKGFNFEAAEDLVQNFFVRRFWESVVDKSSPRLGKLRAFLNESFGNFCKDEWRHSRTLKSGGKLVHQSIEDAGAAEVGESPEKEREMRLSFDRDWAINLWERSVEAMYQEWRENGDEAEYAVYDRHGLIHRDFRQLQEKPNYAQFCSDLGIAEDAARVRVHRFRKHFRGLLRREVWQTLAPTGALGSDDAALEEEFAYLLQVLSHLRRPADEEPAA